MSDKINQLTGEQLLLARIFGHSDTRTIASELDRRALMGASDEYRDILETLRPLRPRRGRSKPVLGAAA